MSRQTFQKVLAVLGERRISRDAVSATLDPARAEIEDFNLESATDTYAAGAFQSSLSLTGNTSHATEKAALSAAAAGSSRLMPLSVGLAPRAPEGSFASLVNAWLASVKWGAERGQLSKFEIKPVASSPLLLGAVLANTTGGAPLSGASNRTAVQLGALPAGATLHLAVHALDDPAPTGTSPTLSLQLQSAASSGFSSPADRLTVPQLSGAGYRWLELSGDAGAVTDTWWRLAVTAVGGTGTPTFHLFAVAAIV